jgi:predicted O-methyltransferase YrrM
MKTLLIVAAFVFSASLFAEPTKPGRPVKNPVISKPTEKEEKKPVSSNPKNVKKPVKIIVEEPKNPTLSEYLTWEGFELSPSAVGQEPYVTDGQKKQFIDLLEKNPQITTVLEIGFNAGHSAEIFLENCKKLETFISIDLDTYPYTNYAIDYLGAKYPGQFYFIQGDSLDKVPALPELFPDIKFDLIYLDGNLSYETCLQDIENLQSFAHPGTILIVNNVDEPTISKATQAAQKMKLITIRRGNPIQDLAGSRNWIEARYRMK